MGTCSPVLTTVNDREQVACLQSLAMLDLLRSMQSPFDDLFTFVRLNVSPSPQKA